MLAGLANGFMVGEEGVTLDIMPLVFAIADEGRAEETLFLTQFAYEEAKHVDFFARWFKAIGADPLEMREISRKNQEARGVKLERSRAAERTLRIHPAAGDAARADRPFARKRSSTAR